VAHKSEKLTCFCPKSGPQIQHSTDTTDQMTISRPLWLFIIVLIHWELVKWICRLFLGHLDISREDCGSEVWKSHLLLPQVWATNPTLHGHHGLDDHLKTTIDPLGAGEMDLQVILGSLLPLPLFLWKELIHVTNVLEKS
jgi:hypothetical protein